MQKGKSMVDNNKGSSKEKRGEVKEQKNKPEGKVSIFDDGYTPYNEVESEGNPAAKILAKAFEEFSQAGLTTGIREKIEKLDDILKDADIVISKEGDKATIAQEDGKTFTVKSKGRNK